MLKVKSNKNCRYFLISYNSCNAKRPRVLSMCTYSFARSVAWGGVTSLSKHRENILLFRVLCLVFFVLPFDFAQGKRFAFCVLRSGFWVPCSVFFACLGRLAFFARLTRFFVWRSRERTLIRPVFDRQAEGGQVTQMRLPPERPPPERPPPERHSRAGSRAGIYADS